MAWTLEPLACREHQAEQEMLAMVPLTKGQTLLDTFKKPLLFVGAADVPTFPAYLFIYFSLIKENWVVLGPWNMDELLHMLEK